MTDAEMQALRAAAEKATPGPWVAENNYKSPDILFGTYVVAATIVSDFRPPQDKANAAYIALANPAAVLALLDRVAAARREEREACAKLARRMIGPGFGEHVEQAIRARKDPTP